MRHEHKPWTLGVILVVALAASSCGASDPDAPEPVAVESAAGGSDSATPSQDSSTDEEPTSGPEAEPTISSTVQGVPAQVEQILRDINPQLGLATHPQVSVFADLNNLADAGAEITMLLSQALDELPDTPEVADIRSALTDWVRAIENSLATLETEQAELQALADAWVEGGRVEDPPMAVVELFETMLFAFAADYKETCLIFGTEFGVAPDCNAVDNDPGEPTPVDPGTLTTTMGSLDLSFSPGVVYDVYTVEPNMVTLELTMFTALTLLLPPAVADPEQPLSATEVTSPVPWPADPAAWAAKLPLTIVKSDSVRIGETEFSTTRITGSAAPAAVIDSPGHPQGAYIMDNGYTVQWWFGTVGEQPIVAIVESVDAEEVEILEEDVERILATISFD